MDTRYGKYQGPLAALLERWQLDDNTPDEDTSNEGDGLALWKGLQVLSWEEAKYLRDEFECTELELDELAQAMLTARALAGAWDDHGFLYGWPVTSLIELDEVQHRIRLTNAWLITQEEENMQLRGVAYE